MAEARITSRSIVVAFVMISMSMVAMEMTIVSTAMPRIVTQLGGLDLYSWVFSAFVLTQTAMTVIFGKLADTYGRRPIMLIGIGIFVAGSVLAGASGTMPLMIASRLIQGIGAGAIMPAALTIIADLYPARERGKIQGYLASVWAISAVVGPIAGAFIIDHASWAWIFWINVPVGLLAAAGFIRYLHTDVALERRSVDYAGAALFTAMVAVLMVALTDTATASAGRLGLCAAAFVVLTVLFVLQERRAADPMISFALWSRRPVAAANGASLVTGMVLMGLTTFLPMYVQGVLHRAPIVAGLTLTMVTLGWPAGATLAARLFNRFGTRPIMVLGGALIPAGAVIFFLLNDSSSPVVAGVGSFVMGLGMGLVSVSSLILIQELVERDQRASATASNLFARNLGSTLGAAILGAVQAFGFARSTGFDSSVHDELGSLLDQTHGSGLVSEIARRALSQSLHLTFSALLVMALLSVLFTLLVPAPAPAGVSEAPAE